MKRCSHTNSFFICGNPAIPSPSQDIQGWNERYFPYSSRITVKKEASQVCRSSFFSIEKLDNEWERMWFRRRLLKQETCERYVVTKTECNNCKTNYRLSFYEKILTKTLFHCKITQIVRANCTSDIQLLVKTCTINLIVSVLLKTKFTKF